MKKLIAMLASFVIIACTGVLSFNAPAQANVVDDFIQVCNSQAPECEVKDEFQDDDFSIGVVGIYLNPYDEIDLQYLNFKEACIPTNPSTTKRFENNSYAIAELENGAHITYDVEESYSSYPFDSVIVCELKS